MTLANQRQCLMTVQKPVILVAIYCKPLRNPQGFVATAMDCPKWRWSHCLRWFLRGAIPHRGWKLAAGQLDTAEGCFENIRVASSWCRRSWPLAIIDRGLNGFDLTDYSDGPASRRHPGLAACARLGLWALVVLLVLLLLNVIRWGI
jgi:hypothetical protein